MSKPRPLLPPAALTLAGQFLYIAATLLHTGGEANNHAAIFAAYAASDAWLGVHAAQFAAMALMLSGMIGIFAVLGDWWARIGAGAAIAALALYGALQAVDGVALKHAVDAWASAGDAESAVRFANAETLRWLEWGMRSYHDYALGLALLAAAIAVVRVGVWPLATMISLSAMAYVAQGWLAGAEGFSPSQSIAIIVGWICNVVWMSWLLLMSLGGAAAISNTNP